MNERTTAALLLRCCCSSLDDDDDGAIYDDRDDVSSRTKTMRKRENERVSAKEIVNRIRKGAGA